MHRTRTIVVTVATAAMVAGVGLIGWGMYDPEGAAGVLPAAVTGPPSSAAAPPVSKGPSPAELARREREKRIKALDNALAEYAKKAPEFSVAVLDHNTGEVYAYRGKEKYETASVVKVDVLAALLLDAQDDDRDLSSTDLSLAKKMIQASDNGATSTLFDRIGSSAGLSAANRRLGLSRTSVSPSWGLTMSTVTDQVALLDKLVKDDSPLSEESRKLALELMTKVEKNQRWGVSAAANEGEEVAIKNGWLARAADGGKWIINSIGRITGGDVNVSVAVLSHGHGNMNGGIEAVEKVARLTRDHLKW